MIWRPLLAAFETQPVLPPKILQRNQLILRFLTRLTALSLVNISWLRSITKQTKVGLVELSIAGSFLLVIQLFLLHKS